jgi:short-subunit dehydrogenase
MSFFEGQIAVVTGASRGIGRAIALDLAREGSVVCLVGRHLESLRALWKTAESVKESLIPYQADLENDKDIQGLAARFQQSFDGLDILVHCAGQIAFGDIESSGIDDFDRQYRINVRAPYLLTQVILPMVRTRKGQIVFVNSSAGVLARGGAAGYSASKHALKAVADALRDEIKMDGVRVISVYPGRTATRMQEEVSRAEGIHYVPESLMQPEDVADVVLDALRLDRKSEITDISLRPAIKGI